MRSWGSSACLAPARGGATVRPSRRTDAPRGGHPPRGRSGPLESLPMRYHGRPDARSDTLTGLGLEGCSRTGTSFGGMVSTSRGALRIARSTAIQRFEAPLTQRDRGKFRRPPYRAAHEGNAVARRPPHREGHAGALLIPPAGSGGKKILRAAAGRVPNPERAPPTSPTGPSASRRACRGVRPRPPLRAHPRGTPHRPAKGWRRDGWPPPARARPHAPFATLAPPSALERKPTEP